MGDALPSPKPRRKLSMVQLSVKIQQEFENYNIHYNKHGKPRLSNKFRNNVIMRKGSIAYCVAQWIIELEKAVRLECERNSAEVIYEIFRILNEVPDMAAFKIINCVRKRDLQEVDLPEHGLLPAIPNPPEFASLNKFYRVIKCYGIHADDPRLGQTIDRQRKIEAKLEKDEINTNPLTKEDFIHCIHPAVELVSRAFRNELQIPQWLKFVVKMKEIFKETAFNNSEGSVATYIPQLARQNPEWFGLSVCTIDGSRLRLGDSKVPFCLQSVSKAFNYAAVSSDIGYHAIHAHVGHEPSGRLFNEICLDNDRKPHNPMINAGAIIVTSLIKNEWPMAERFDYIIEKYRKIAGTFPVEFNNATFLSERESADRNYALAYFMKENKCFPKTEIMNLREELELYFQLCSLECNCETLSVMAATLANGGINPLTYERVIDAEACRDTLSLMYSCGMYDLSGKFAFEVGVPAKSGVSGAVMIVIPSVLGLVVFSPKLDRTGNSTRGVAFCKAFMKNFAFHNYDHLHHSDDLFEKIDPRKPARLSERDIIVGLLYAVQNNKVDVLQRYFMKGYDLEMADYDGRTALHIAASQGYYHIVKFLLSRVKVKWNPMDKWGHTPLEEAIRFNHRRCEKLLFKYQRNEMAEMGLREGAELSDMSDVSDSDEETYPLRRTRRTTVVEKDVGPLKAAAGAATCCSKPLQAPSIPTPPSSQPPSIPTSTSSSVPSMHASSSSSGLPNILTCSSSQSIANQPTPSSGPPSIENTPSLGLPAVQTSPSSKATIQTTGTSPNQTTPLSKPLTIQTHSPHNTIEEEEEESSEVSSSDDEMVPLGRGLQELPPMIKRPSTHGLQR